MLIQHAKQSEQQCLLVLHKLPLITEKVNWVLHGLYCEDGQWYSIIKTNIHWSFLKETEESGSTEFCCNKTHVKA